MIYITNSETDSNKFVCAIYPFKLFCNDEISIA